LQRGKLSGLELAALAAVLRVLVRIPISGSISLVRRSAFCCLVALWMVLFVGAAAPLGQSSRLALACPASSCSPGLLAIRRWTRVVPMTFGIVFALRRMSVWHTRIAGGGPKLRRVVLIVLTMPVWLFVFRFISACKTPAEKPSSITRRVNQGVCSGEKRRPDEPARF